MPPTCAKCGYAHGTKQLCLLRKDCSDKVYGKREVQECACTPEEFQQIEEAGRCICNSYEWDTLAGEGASTLEAQLENAMRRAVTWHTFDNLRRVQQLRVLYTLLRGVRYDVRINQALETSRKATVEETIKAMFANKTANHAWTAYGFLDPDSREYKVITLPW